MARSEEDSVSRDTTPKSDNPFVRFRRAADERISTVLQGIIGLPSVMTRPGTAQWADWDEDLRRRDELQARQRELKESEAKRLQGDHYGGASKPASPVAEGQTNVMEKGLPEALALKAGWATHQFDHDVLHTLHNMPLYSAGTRTLLADLGPLGDRRLGWSNLQLLRSACEIDPLAALRRDVFLGRSGKMTLLDRHETSQTLLPYLLLSPYSPLKLSIASSLAGKENFPFCHAFEDLVRVSASREMVSASRRQYLYQPSCSLEQSGFMKWIVDMQDDGILVDPSSLEDITTTQGHGNVSEHDLTAENERSAAKTEEEMYRHFLHSASEPSPTDGLSRILEALVSDPNRSPTFPDFLALLREVAEGKTETAKMVRSSSEEMATSILDGLFGIKTVFDSENPMKTVYDILSKLESPDSPAKSTTMATKTVVTKPDLESRTQMDDATPSERIVSTSTTSQRMTNENGSVETSVTVWKRFADGRETVTTTSHVDDNRRDEDGLEPSSSGTKNKYDETKEKRGWFWG